MEILLEQYEAGKRAYEKGARTADEARKLNPHKSFGEKSEHQRFISWNRGWNEAKKTDQGE